MNNIRSPLVAFFILLVAVSAHAETRSAEVSYMLQCQGCHTPSGAGVADRVPSFVGMLGNFLMVDGGRNFLIQVPGAAQSSLSDKELALVTNWMLQKFSPAQVPDDFVPYTASEVSQLRQKPLVRVVEVRQKLLELMGEQGINTAI